MITKRGNSLILYQILSTNSVRKCREISVENLHVDVGGSLLIALCKQNHVTKRAFVYFHSLRSSFLSWT